MLCFVIVLSNGRERQEQVSGAALGSGVGRRAAGADFARNISQSGFWRLRRVRRVSVYLKMRQSHACRVRKWGRGAACGSACHDVYLMSTGSKVHQETPSLKGTSDNLQFKTWVGCQMNSRLQGRSAGGQRGHCRASEGSSPSSAAHRSASSC